MASCFIAVSNASMGKLPLLDIKSSQVLDGLTRSHGKEIPFSLLYDDAGVQIYEEITRLEEYYLFSSELYLLRKHVRHMVSKIPPQSLLVELGCGTATKTASFLNAAIALHGRCRYAGIDICPTALCQGRDALLANVKELKHGDIILVQGDYFDGLREVRKMYPNDMLCILWLGSSVGNLSRENAISFFRQMLEIVGPQCQVFLCTDLWKDEKLLHAAYCDQKGVTERFIKNGMKHALGLLGHVVTPDEEQDWIYQVDVNKDSKQVEMRIVFPRGLHIHKYKIHIKGGENVLVEFSRKFTLDDIQELASKSGFCIHETWRNRLYSCQMLLSGLEALRCCWDDTDALFSSVPDWRARPIHLRHPFCFYYGHVNAFTKLKCLPTEPSTQFDYIFSRGMDPVVLDPTKCHSHPEIPPEWPSKEQLCNYVRSIRSSMKEACMVKGKVSMRLVYLALEHERMHQETLIYMLAQQRKQVWESCNLWRGEGFINKRLIPIEPNRPSITIPAGKVTLGAENRCKERGIFVWDNEVPAWRTSVSSFRMSPKAVSIGEFMRFVLEGGYGRAELWEAEDFAFFGKSGFKWPATWSMDGSGECYVHGMSGDEGIGSKQWNEVAEEPVYVSLSEAEAYCRWAGGYRVMREEEYERAVDHLTMMKRGELVEEEEEDAWRVMDGGWEWTSSVFGPFPGFEAMPEYWEYSSDFFDGKHYVLKGCSPATHPSMRRRSFRNFYQRQYRYVFAKFRCCQ